MLHPELGRSAGKAVPTRHYQRSVWRNLLRQWWILILTIPSLYLLCLFPPLWKDIDGVNQLVAAPGVINVLHFPPLYCFLGRIPFWLTSGNSILQRQAPVPQYCFSLRDTL